MESIATKHFIRLQAYEVIICKECKHAVWPKEVDSHLSGKYHQVKKEERDLVQEWINSNWQGLITDPVHFTAPIEVEELLPELSLHEGWRCKFCMHIITTEKSLRKHWREAHKWKLTESEKGGGRMSGVRKKQAEERIDQGCEKVRCQRFFPSRHGSQYFRIKERQEEGPAIDQWQRICQEAKIRLESMEEEANKVIQDGEKTEVNRWLERAGWKQYLIGLDRDELMAVVEKPGGRQGRDERVEVEVWKAMTEVATISQQTTSKANYLIRSEAVRAEAAKTVKKPLKIYWKPESIEKRVQPWRQILMFFVRTQAAHNWKSPVYRFTHAQLDKFRRLIEEVEHVIGQREEMKEMDNKEEEEEGMTTVRQACLDFCIELLNQEMVFSEWDCALNCAMAVLGVEKAGWRQEEVYTSIISSVVKCARYMVVEKATGMSASVGDGTGLVGGRRLDIEEDSGYESNNSSPRSSPPPTSSQVYQWSNLPGQNIRTSSPPTTLPSSPARPSQRSNSKKKNSCLQSVKIMMDAFMIRGTAGPMEWMLDLRAYGMAGQTRTTAIGHVQWRGSDELLYRGAQFNMGQFRGMVHGILKEAQRIMKEELLFCSGKLEHEMPAVSLKTLYDDPTNSRAGFNFLKDKRTRVPADGNSWLFNRIGEKAALRQEFERTTSQSGIDRARVERYMDSTKQFREKLLLLMHITGGQPARGTELLSVMHTNTTESHRNIFVEDGMVAFVTRYHKGYAKTGDYKIIHRYLPREVGEMVVLYLWIILPFQKQMQMMVYQQGATSTFMWPSKDVGGKKWSTDRIARLMKWETAGRLGHALNVLDYRQVAIGISRKFMRGTTTFEGDDGEKAEEGDIADEQAAHSSITAGMLYARGVMELPGVVESKRQLFRASSEDWHRFLGFASAVEDNKHSGTKRKCPFDSNAEEREVGRRKRLREMDAVSQFKKMIKKDVDFRGIQRKAIDTIKAGVSPVVCVMPTGAGKSVLFMLPAWSEPAGTTIVVVPLIALRKDMIRRCDELGIGCVEWDESVPPDGVSIVMVTPEKAISGAFGTFINRLNAVRQLDRIVIDECHVILNDQDRFRTRLQRLGELASARTQMILLTATLPLCQEGLLLERMGWRREEVTLLRMATVRKNIRYQVISADAKLRAHQHDMLVAGLVQKEQGKVVVYCNSRTRVERLVKSGLFKCDGFHARITDSKKAEVLDQFRTGETRVIVATNAFGVGIDIPDIRLVIHADEPRDFIDFAQESGRAGRDGQRSVAVIVTGAWESEDKCVRRFVGEYGCRRKILDEYFDGAERRKECGKDEESCDRCRGEEESIEGREEEVEGESEGEETVSREEEMEIWRQNKERETISRRLAERRMDEAKMLLKIVPRLADWKNVCIVCRGLGLDYRHVVTDCRHEIGKKASIQVKRRRIRIRFQEGRCCFKCGIPQSICDRFDERGACDVGVLCEYYGIITSVVFGLRYGYEKMNKRWERRLDAMGIKQEDEKEVEEYLGRIWVVGGVEMYRILYEFNFITEKIAEEIEGR